MSVNRVAAVARLRIVSLGPTLLAAAFGVQGCQNATVPPPAATASGAVQKTTMQPPAATAGVAAQKTTVQAPAATASGAVQKTTVQPPAATAADASQTLEKGRELFANFACGSCHALADAKATGAVGPALDGNRNLTKAFVVDRVTNGQGAMPAYGGQLTDREIDQLASYITQVAKK